MVKSICSSGKVFVGARGAEVSAQEAPGATNTQLYRDYHRGVITALLQRRSGLVLQIVAKVLVEVITSIISTLPSYDR